MFIGLREITVGCVLVSTMLNSSRLAQLSSELRALRCIGVRYNGFEGDIWQRDELTIMGG